MCHYDWLNMSLCLYYDIYKLSVLRRYQYRFDCLNESQLSLYSKMRLQETYRDHEGYGQKPLRTEDPGSKNV